MTGNTYSARDAMLEVCFVVKKKSSVSRNPNDLLQQALT